MITFERTLIINRPQQEVFDFVSDPANTASWQEATEFAEWTSDAPHGVGSTAQGYGRFLGRKMETTIEVTDWNPPNHYTEKVVSGPIPYEATMELKTTENGTQIHFLGQAEVTGLFKLAEGLIRRQLLNQIDLDLETLKRLMEAG